MVVTSLFFKHCQRHNGPEGWVHITRSQFTVHKSWTYYNFRISIKHQLQNLNQTSASLLNFNFKSWPNLASEYRPRCFVSSKVFPTNQVHPLPPISQMFIWISNILQTWCSPKIIVHHVNCNFSDSATFPSMIVCREMLGKTSIENTKTIVKTKKIPWWMFEVTHHLNSKVVDSYSWNLFTSDFQKDSIQIDSFDKGMEGKWSGSTYSNQSSSMEYLFLAPQVL